MASGQENGNTGESSALPDIYVVLLHYPVYHKDGKIMATSVTNLDLHDIARSCLTYEVATYYVVNPLKSQQYFGRRIMRYWLEGPGAVYNKTRQDAFQILEFRDNFDEVKGEIRAKHGADPLLLATDARTLQETVSPEEAMAAASAANRPLLLLLGTGYGIDRDLIESCDLFLAPVRPGGYNHLSVRAAAAILLDRLVGERRRERTPATDKARADEARR